MDSLKQAPATTAYTLKEPAFLHPTWLNQFRHGRQEGEVVESGDVLVHGQLLPFADPSSTLPAGTKVLVWASQRFWCVDAAVVERYQSGVREQAQAAAEARQRARALEIEDNKAFNKTLYLPVPWVCGIKDVLSGLSERSNGDGRSKATVIHVLLEEALTAGRLVRPSGAFLCSSAGTKQARNWTGQRFEDAADTGSVRVTCKKCLEIASRFVAPRN